MLRLCLFGAPLDTGNRGVEALGRAVLSGVARNTPDGRLTMFDNGWGVRPGPLVGQLQVDLCGVRQSRRVHRRESWLNVRASQHLRLPGSAVAQRIRESDAVLDISGGDSFSDLYGRGRLHSVLQPKQAALRAGRPLVLLPQTYGPFADPAARSAAVQVLRRVDMAWARDDDSYQALCELLGPRLDPDRHRRGVDVAFALPPRRPAELPGDLIDLLEADRTDNPLVGVNVSGLLWSSGRSSDRFGLSLNYQDTLIDLVEGLARRGCRVLLLPHVEDVAHQQESDGGAARALHELLHPEAASRVQVGPGDLLADEVKWLISRLDWFCGSRMHATIAALSTEVPTAALAYSMKTRGVFASCGLGDEVVDARRTGRVEAVQRLLDSYDRRRDLRQTLQLNAPRVVQSADAQIAQICKRIAGRPPTRSVVPS